VTTELNKETLQVPDSALHDIGLHEQITAIKTGAEAKLHSKDIEASDAFYAIDKLEAHLSNVRHMAVSIFVFDGDRLLLQRRADTKYHSGGLWANTVCSHPRWNETIYDCATRRLNEELGWAVPLIPFGSIDYTAQVGDLYENEHVRCFHGRFNQSHNINKFNQLEVGAVEWMSIPQVLQQIEKRPETFTQWFKIYMSEHRHMIEAII